MTVGLPTEKELSDAILRATLTTEQKEKILKSLRYMNSVKIIELYNELQGLANLESEVSTKISQCDLKYKIMLQKELEKNTT